MKKVFLTVSIILALCFASVAWAAPGDSANDPILVSTPAELDNVRLGLDKYYKLSNDIDLTAYLSSGGAGYAKWGQAGWAPIGTTYYEYFSGGFDGGGHKIIGLWIDRSSTSFVGLFGYTLDAEFKNLGLEIASPGVKGDYDVGGLIGLQQGESSIINCYTTGNVSGNDCVGGLVGVQYISNMRGDITNCYSTGNVTAINGGAGGLVGEQRCSDGGRGNITNCYAAGNVSGNYPNGSSTVGGLVGEQIANTNGVCSITNSYATGNINAAGYLAYVGGLVGYQYAVYSINAICNITNCYATGNVTSTSHAGGLVGYQYSYDSGISNITSCYATGNVGSDLYGGGLLGRQNSANNGKSNITTCYATGNVMATGSTIGGLVGSQYSLESGVNTITSSYRYINLTVNGSVIPVASNDVNGAHGGVKTADEFMTKGSYTANSWLFNDSTPAAGSWYWDSRGFPKLNMGIENFPFPWGPINITPTITITTQPQSTTVIEGSITGSLSVEASVTPSGTLSYQWYANVTNNNTSGTPISGAASASFTIPAGLTAGRYYYYCIVGAVGALPVTSNVATVIVNAGPTILPVITIDTQPKATTTVTEGSITGSLSVAASVTPSGTLSYQWYSNTTNNNTSGTPISGATSASFTIPTSLTAGRYYYYCIVGAAGALPVTSNVATVNVEECSGCNAIGYGGYLMFALFSTMPFVIRKRK